MSQSLFRVLFAVLVFFGCPAMSVSAAELETITNATLVNADLNDGDSFKVEAGGRELHLRLYYVDCPEITYNTKAEQERIRELQGYFGLDEPHAVVRFGRQAADYVEQVLSSPFTVHTSHARAMGRSASGRVYAFVETHDGRDLGHLLVEQGLARIHGKTRPSPDGLRSDRVLAELRDLNDRAMLNRAGIWAETNPDIIADKRRRQREAKQEQEEFRKNLKKLDAPSTTNPMDLNTAPKKQLETIHGIGPVRAEQIIVGRPWCSVKELLKIPGIGPKTLKKIAPYMMVDPSTTNPMDLNSASKEQLESVYGIGPVRAEHIIAGRPWGAVEELLDISSIWPERLKDIAPCVTVRDQP